MGSQPKPAMRPSTAERLQRRRSERIYERIYIGERKDTPRAWTVEAFHHDGAIEQAIFIGPYAKARAKRHMKSEYGK